MKKKTLILMLILAVLSTMIFTACGGGSKTLEEYVANNTEMQESIDAAMNGSNAIVKVKDNEIIYEFDLSKMEGYTEEIAKSEEVTSALETALISSGPTFGGIAKTLEEQTKVKGITVTVNYTWEDEVLLTRSFTSAEAVEELAE